MPKDTSQLDPPNEWIDHEIPIPKSSFTAFRLLYGDAQEISYVSKVVLLGSIPKLWYREQNSSILRSITKASYSKVHKAARGVGNRVNSTYRFGANELYKDRNMKKFLFLTHQFGVNDFDDTDSGNDSEDFNLNYNEDDDDYLFWGVNDVVKKDDTDPAQSDMGRTPTAPRQTGTDVTQFGAEDENTKKDTFKVPSIPSKSFPNNTQEVSNPSKSNLPLIKIGDESQPSVLSQQITEFPDSNAQSSVESSVQSFYSAVENIATNSSSKVNVNLPELNFPTSNNSSSSTDTIKPETPESFSQPNGNLTDTRSKDSSLYSNMSPQESVLSAPSNPKVRFQKTSTGEIKRRSASAQFLKPEPEENPLILPLDPRHERALNKIKAVASRTKRHVRGDIHNINQRRIFQKLLRSYKIGEIIKMEKMLVLVKQAVNSNVAVFTSFTEVEPCDTRILERWKEYIVVIRSTGEYDEPVLIQFYTRREIPHEETSKHSNDELDFTLSKNCLVNFYSSLDKTIAIVKKGKIYILRPQTPSSSVRWLTFLNETLGISNPGVFKVQIPKLSISVNVKVTEELFQKLVDEEANKYIRLICKRQGYHAHDSPVLEYLVQKIKSELTKAGYAKFVENWNNRSLVLALCWRHYDRLEWIFGETLSNLFLQHSMYSTHDLEIRVSQHYPKEVTTEATGTINEPTPIEGFLARLSSRHGNNRNFIGKQIFKFSYFFTSNQLLFFCRSYKALPPIPDYEYLTEPKFLSNPENFEKIRSHIPPIYEHNPYEADDNGHIKWLKPNLTEEEFSQYDRFASYEYERRVVSIVRADSVIDMTDIVNVKAISADSLSAAVRAADNYAWEESLATLKDESDESKDSFFQIEFQNGTFFTLKARSSSIRNEWVSRLTELIKYWKLRLADDIKKIHEVKFTNIARLNIDDYMEANVGEATPKWENSRGVADPAVHNITPNAMFRPIVRCGMLYQKPKKHAVFNNYFVCLIPGFIILYKVFSRNMNGLALPTTHYKHYFTIPLNECYIYSGSTSGMDLLDRDSEIDRVNLDRNSLPRIYKDGWISSEDEASRCFTLWFGTKRAIAGKMLMKNKEAEFNDYGSENPGIIKMVNRLGVTGRSVVFMCRSRQERDLWVNNIYTEVERFHKTEELKE